MKSVAELLEEAGQLPPDQRLTLAHRLIATTELVPPSDVEDQWDNVIRERIARYDRGESKASPVHEVLSRIDSRLNDDS